MEWISAETPPDKSEFPVLVWWKRGEVATISDPYYFEYRSVCDGMYQYKQDNVTHWTFLDKPK